MAGSQDKGNVERDVFLGAPVSFSLDARACCLAGLAAELNA